MKKSLCFLLCLCLLFVLSACAKAEPANEASPIDVDLTALSSTMVYSEVYNMLTEPDSYLGKTVKMRGAFTDFFSPETNKHYFSCLIADATACCSQGVEFVLTEDYAYPEDYPAEGAQICVVGTFSTYVENDRTYCTLRNATLE